MTKRAQSVEKIDAKIREWMVPFTREFEMAMAHGTKLPKAIEAGIREVKRVMQKEWNEKPSERSFLIDVRLAIKDRYVAEAKEILRRAA